eukprot:6064225-Alexandrium_andersonii.AAC.1
MSSVRRSTPTGALDDPRSLLGVLKAMGVGDTLPEAAVMSSITSREWDGTLDDAKIRTDSAPGEGEES